MSVKVSQLKEVYAVTSPEDYKWLFLLQTTNRQFYLYAHTAEEREIWVHEFANFCVEH